MLRHSSNYPSFINSRHPDTPAYNPRDTIGGQLFQWCSVDEARREEEEEEDSIFYSRYRGDKSNKINQTPWRKTIGEKEQICFVYIEAFIDRPIYMHDLYALYARSLSKCSIWRELDSIIRELHHYFSSTFLFDNHWVEGHKEHTFKPVVFLFTRLKLFSQPPNEKRKRLVSQWRSCLKAGLAEFESRRLPLSRSSCLLPISPDFNVTVIDLPVPFAVHSLITRR